MSLPSSLNQPPNSQKTNYEALLLPGLFASLSPKTEKEKETDLMTTATAALEADLFVIRAALLWLSHHPQLTPMFYTLGKYAANHTLTSCFGKGTCQNCNRCLHFLGLDIDHVGTMDLCESALMSAYAEAIHHPYLSLQMATKGMEVIQQGISDLASMPEIATEYHSKLAHLINTEMSVFEHKLAIPNNLTFQNILNKGDEIYKKGGATTSSAAWLYVGLPEVFAKVKQMAEKDEKKIQDIITEVYNKWRQWGKDNTTTTTKKVDRMMMLHPAT